MSHPRSDSAPAASTGPLMLFLGLAALAFVLAQTAIVPGLSTLATSLNTTTDNVAWITTGYLVASAILTPVIGRLGDMFGKGNMLLIVLIIFFLGSVGAALAGNVWMLVAARIVQGVGGGIIPLCFGIIGDIFPAERRASALGIISAISGIGAGIGLLVGGLLIDNLSWEWVFWMGAALAAIAAVGAFTVRDAGTKTPGRIDFVGIGLLAVGLTAPLIALSRGQAWGWASLNTLGLAAAGLAVLVAFVFYELHVDDPLVDMRIIGGPTVLMINIATLLMGAGMFGIFMLIPQIAQTPKAFDYGFGLNATQAGLLLLPGSLFMLVAGATSNRLSVRFGARTPLTVGSFLTALGLVLLALKHDTVLIVALFVIVSFIGIGFAMASLPSLIMGSVPESARGQANGVNVLMRTVGSSIGSQAVGTLLAGSVTAATLVPTDAAFATSFWIGAGAAMAAAVVGSLIPLKAAPKPILVHTVSATQEVTSA